MQQLLLEQQDLSIANYVIEEGRSLVIAVNKWDLIKLRRNYEEEFTHKLEKFLPISKRHTGGFYFSNKSNYKINEVLDRAVEMYDLWNKKYRQVDLMSGLLFATQAHQLPLQKKIGKKS